MKQLDHYPVRRKGERRRLDPDWGAIRWLEGETFETDTEISGTYEMGVPGSASGEREFIVQRALGWHTAQGKNMYPQPMFTVSSASAFKIRMSVYPDPCPDCDNWARTSRCAVHHDRDGIAGLDMGGARRSTWARSADFTITLEIDGETVQGVVRSLRMEVEGNGGRT